MTTAMTMVADEPSSEIHRIVRRFEDRLKLARASELAMDGHFLEAEALLCPALGDPSSREELDLLARIHVKQGRYEDARRRWREAAGGAGEKMDFQESIAAMDEWLGFRRALFRWRMKLVLWFITANLIAAMLLRFGSH